MWAGGTPWAQHPLPPEASTSPRVALAQAPEDGRGGFPLQGHGQGDVQPLPNLNFLVGYSKAKLLT